MGDFVLIKLGLNVRFKGFWYIKLFLLKFGMTNGIKKI